MAPITSLAQLDPNGSYTYADYLTWKLDEFVELIKGRVRRPTSAPAPLHQQYSVNPTTKIRQFLKGKPYRVYHAPFGVRLTRREPATPSFRPRPALCRWRCGAGRGVERGVRGPAVGGRCLARKCPRALPLRGSLTGASYQERRRDRPYDALATSSHAKVLIPVSTPAPAGFGSR